MARLTDKKAEYARWLANPRREGSKAQWARDNHCARSTLTKWERDPEFDAVLDQTIAADSLTDDKLAEVIRGLQGKAATGDAQAGRLYKEFLSELAPKRPIVEDVSVRSLSDEELANELQAALDSVVERIASE